MGCCQGSQPVVPAQLVSQQTDQKVYAQLNESLNVSNQQKADPHKQPLQQSLPQQFDQQQNPANQRFSVPEAGNNRCLPINSMQDKLEQRTDKEVFDNNNNFNNDPLQQLSSPDKDGSLRKPSLPNKESVLSPKIQNTYSSSSHSSQQTINFFPKKKHNKTKGPIKSEQITSGNNSIKLHCHSNNNQGKSSLSSIMEITYTKKAGLRHSKLQHPQLLAALQQQIDLWSNIHSQFIQEIQNDCSDNNRTLQNIDATKRQCQQAMDSLGLFWPSLSMQEVSCMEVMSHMPYPLLSLFLQEKEVYSSVLEISKCDLLPNNFPFTGRGDNLFHKIACNSLLTSHEKLEIVKQAKHRLGQTVCDTMLLQPNKAGNIPIVQYLKRCSSALKGENNVNMGIIDHLMPDSRGMAQLINKEQSRHLHDCQLYLLNANYWQAHLIQHSDVKKSPSYFAKAFLMQMKKFNNDLLMSVAQIARKADYKILADQLICSIVEEHLPQIQMDTWIFEVIKMRDVSGIRKQWRQAKSEIIGGGGQSYRSCNYCGQLNFHFYIRMHFLEELAKKDLLLSLKMFFSKCAPEDCFRNAEPLWDTSTHQQMDEVKVGGEGGGGVNGDGGVDGSGQGGGKGGGDDCVNVQGQRQNVYKGGDKGNEKCKGIDIVGDIDKKCPWCKGEKGSDSPKVSSINYQANNFNNAKFVNILDIILTILIKEKMQEYSLSQEVHNFLLERALEVMQYHEKDLANILTFSSPFDATIHVQQTGAWRMYTANPLTLNKVFFLHHPEMMKLCDGQVVDLALSRATTEQRKELLRSAVLLNDLVLLKYLDSKLLLKDSTLWIDKAFSAAIIELFFFNSEIVDFFFPKVVEFSDLPTVMASIQVQERLVRAVSADLATETHKKIISLLVVGSNNSSSCSNIPLLVPQESSLTILLPRMNTQTLQKHFVKLLASRNILPNFLEHTALQSSSSSSSASSSSQEQANQERGSRHWPDKNVLSFVRCILQVLILPQRQHTLSNDSTPVEEQQSDNLILYYLDSVLEKVFTREKSIPKNAFQRLGIDLRAWGGFQLDSIYRRLNVFFRLMLLGFPVQFPKQFVTTLVQVQGKRQQSSDDSIQMIPSFQKVKAQVPAINLNAEQFEILQISLRQKLKTSQAMASSDRYVDLLKHYLVGYKIRLARRNKLLKFALRTNSLLIAQVIIEADETVLDSLLHKKGNEHAQQQGQYHCLFFYLQNKLFLEHCQTLQNNHLLKRDLQKVVAHEDCNSLINGGNQNLRMFNLIIRDLLRKQNPDLSAALNSNFAFLYKTFEKVVVEVEDKIVELYEVFYEKLLQKSQDNQESQESEECLQQINTLLLQYLFYQKETVTGSASGPSSVASPDFLTAAHTNSQSYVNSYFLVRAAPFLSLPNLQKLRQGSFIVLLMQGEEVFTQFFTTLVATREADVCQFAIGKLEQLIEGLLTKLQQLASGEVKRVKSYQHLFKCFASKELGAALLEGKHFNEHRIIFGKLLTVLECLVLRTNENVNNETNSTEQCQRVLQNHIYYCVKNYATVNVEQALYLIEYDLLEEQTVTKLYRHFLAMYTAKCHENITEQDNTLQLEKLLHKLLGLFQVQKMDYRQPQQPQFQQLVNKLSQRQKQLINAYSSCLIIPFTYVLDECNFNDVMHINKNYFMLQSGKSAASRCLSTSSLKERKSLEKKHGFLQILCAAAHFDKLKIYFQMIEHYMTTSQMLIYISAGLLLCGISQHGRITLEQQKQWLGKLAELQSEKSEESWFDSIYYAFSPSTFINQLGMQKSQLDESCSNEALDSLKRSSKCFNYLISQLQSEHYRDLQNAHLEVIQQAFYYRIQSLKDHPTQAKASSNNSPSINEDFGHEMYVNLNADIISFLKLTATHSKEMSTTFLYNVLIELIQLFQPVDQPEWLFCATKELILGLFTESIISQFQDHHQQQCQQDYSLTVDHSNMYMCPHFLQQVFQHNQQHRQQLQIKVLILNQLLHQFNPGFRSNVLQVCDKTILALASLLFKRKVFIEGLPQLFVCLWNQMYEGGVEGLLFYDVNLKETRPYLDTELQDPGSKILEILVEPSNRGFLMKYFEVQDFDPFASTRHLYDFKKDMDLALQGYQLPLLPEKKLLTFVDALVLKGNLWLLQKYRSAIEVNNLQTAQIAFLQNSGEVLNLVLERVFEQEKPKIINYIKENNLLVQLACHKKNELISLIYNQYMLQYPQAFREELLGSHTSRAALWMLLLEQGMEELFTRLLLFAAQNYFKDNLMECIEQIFFSCVQQDNMGMYCAFNNKMIIASISPLLQKQNTDDQFVIREAKAEEIQPVPGVSNVQGVPGVQGDIEDAADGNNSSGLTGNAWTKPLKEVFDVIFRHNFFGVIVALENKGACIFSPTEKQIYNNIVRVIGEMLKQYLSQLRQQDRQNYFEQRQLLKFFLFLFVTHKEMFILEFGLLLSCTELSDVLLKLVCDSDNKQLFFDFQFLRQDLASLREVQCIYHSNTGSIQQLQLENDTSASVTQTTKTITISSESMLHAAKTIFLAYMQNYNSAGNQTANGKSNNSTIQFEVDGESLEVVLIQYFKIRAGEKDSDSECNMLYDFTDSLIAVLSLADQIVQTHWLVSSSSALIQSEKNEKKKQIHIFFKAAILNNGTDKESSVIISEQQIQLNTVVQYQWMNLEDGSDSQHCRVPKKSLQMTAELTNLQQMREQIQNFYFFEEQQPYIEQCMDLLSKIGQLNLQDLTLEFQFDYYSIPEEAYRVKRQVLNEIWHQEDLHQLQHQNQDDLSPLQMKYSFGLIDLLEDLSSLFAVAGNNSRYYGTADRFAPHNDDNLRVVQRPPLVQQQQYQQQQQLQPPLQQQQTLHQTHNSHLYNSQSQSSIESPQNLRQTHTVLFQQQQHQASQNHLNSTQYAAEGQQDVFSQQQQQIYILEQMPDNTYQVRLNQSQRKDNEKLVFAEFYELQKQYLKPVQIKYISPEEFKAKVQPLTILESMKQSLTLYDFLVTIIINNPQEQDHKPVIQDMLDSSWNSWCFSFAEAQDSQHQELNLLYRKELFPLYNIVRLRAVFNRFINEVKQRHKTYQDNIDQLELKFNFLSFLEVLVIPIARLPFLGQVQVNNQKDVWQLIDLILESQLLKKIIDIVVFQNLVSAENIMKVIRGIYIEFNEIKPAELPVYAEQAANEFQQADRVIRFGKTNYYIYKYMLVIRLNVCIVSAAMKEVKLNSMMPPKPNTLQVGKTTVKQQGEQPPPLFEKDSVKAYLLVVSNKFDFYEQIFTPEQILFFVLNKIELDNCFLKMSQDFSHRFSQIMTISLNYDKMQQVFKALLYAVRQERDNIRRIMYYEQIWACLENLSQYFYQKMYNELTQQLDQPKYQELFYILLYNFCRIINDKDTLTERVAASIKVYSCEEMDRIFSSFTALNYEVQFLEIVPVSHLNRSFFQYSFALQIDINYFLSQSKVGEVYMIGQQSKNLSKQVMFVQIATKKKESIYYIDLKGFPMEKAETLTMRQQYYQGDEQEDLYEKLAEEEIQFVWLVTKAWPDQSQMKIQLKNLAIIDWQLHFCLINNQKFLDLCQEIAAIDSDEKAESKEFQRFLYRRSVTLDSSELKLNSLIQLYPSTVSFDFELCAELSAGAATSVGTAHHQQQQPTGKGFFIFEQESTRCINYLKHFYQQQQQQAQLQLQQKQQNAARASKNDQLSLKIKINPDLSFSVQQIECDSYNLAAEFELNTAIQLQIKLFLQNVTRLLHRCGQTEVDLEKNKIKLKKNLFFSFDFSEALNERKTHFLQTLNTYLHYLLTAFYEALESLLSEEEVCDQGCNVLNEYENLEKMLQIYDPQIKNDSNPISYLLSQAFLKHFSEIRFEFSAEKEQPIVIASGSSTTTTSSLLLQQQSQQQQQQQKSQQQLIQLEEQAAAAPLYSGNNSNSSIVYNEQTQLLTIKSYLHQTKNSIQIVEQQQIADNLAYLLFNQERKLLLKDMQNNQKLAQIKNKDLQSKNKISVQPRSCSSNIGLFPEKFKVGSIMITAVENCSVQNKALLKYILLMDYLFYQLNICLLAVQKQSEDIFKKIAVVQVQILKTPSSQCLQNSLPPMFQLQQLPDGKTFSIDLFVAGNNNTNNGFGHQKRLILPRIQDILSLFFGGLNPPIQQQQLQISFPLESFMHLQQCIMDLAKTKKLQILVNLNNTNGTVVHNSVQTTEGNACNVSNVLIVPNGGGNGNGSHTQISQMFSDELWQVLLINCKTFALLNCKVSSTRMINSHRQLELALALEQPREIVASGQYIYMVFYAEKTYVSSNYVYLYQKDKPQAINNLQEISRFAFAKTQLTVRNNFSFLLHVDCADQLQTKQRNIFMMHLNKNTSGGPSPLGGVRKRRCEKLLVKRFSFTQLKHLAKNQISQNFLQENQLFQLLLGSNNIINNVGMFASNNANNNSIQSAGNNAGIFANTNTAGIIASNSANSPFTTGNNINNFASNNNNTNNCSNNNQSNYTSNYSSNFVSNQPSNNASNNGSAYATQIMSCYLNQQQILKRLNKRKSATSMSGNGMFWRKKQGQFELPYLSFKWVTKNLLAISVFSYHPYTLNFRTPRPQLVSNSGGGDQFRIGEQLAVVFMQDDKIDFSRTKLFKMEIVDQQQVEYQQSILKGKNEMQINKMYSVIQSINQSNNNNVDNLLKNTNNTFIDGEADLQRIAHLLPSNILLVLQNKNQQTYSQAGQKRKDYLKLFGLHISTQAEKDKLASCLKAIIVHSIYTEIAYRPEVNVILPEEEEEPVVEEEEEEKKEEIKENQEDVGLIIGAGTEQLGNKKASARKNSNNHSAGQDANPYVNLQAIDDHCHGIKHSSNHGAIGDGNLFVIIELTWTPFTKGVYNLIINNTLIDTKALIVVIANQISQDKTILELPEAKEVSYNDKLAASFYFRDKYGNVFSELEKNQFIGPEKNIVELALQSHEEISQIKVVYGSIEKNGFQKISFHYEMMMPLDSDFQNSQDNVELQVFLHDNLRETLRMHIFGICLEERKRLLYEDFYYMGLPDYGEEKLVISRQKFEEQLLEVLENVTLRKSLYVNFDGEMGIDYGGVKREFYEMVGQFMKDQNLKLLTPLHLANTSVDAYYFHPEVAKQKDNLRYITVFGKFIAHTIMMGEILGIEFAQPLIKILYGQHVQFEDLQNYLDKETFANYQLLQNASQQDLDAVDITFAIQDNNQLEELKENGNTVKVTTENVGEYLDLIARFYIYKKFEQQIQSFREGFEQIFDIECMSKYIQAHEFFIFTCGIKNLTPETLINYIRFEKGNSIIVNYFKRFLRECNQEMLKNFLKFSTGSSSLPYYSQSDFCIEIRFFRVDDIKRLPLAHTCYRQIEVPIYPSFEHLKKKLTTALNYGCEGFDLH